MALARCRDCFYFEGIEDSERGHCLLDPPTVLGFSDQLLNVDPVVQRDRIRCRHFGWLYPVSRDEERQADEDGS